MFEKVGKARRVARCWARRKSLEVDVAGDGDGIAGWDLVEWWHK